MSKGTQNETGRGQGARVTSKEAIMANLSAGSLAVNVTPNGGRTSCRLVRPWLSADGEALGWVVRAPEATRSGWAVPFSNLEPAQ